MRIISTISKPAKLLLVISSTVLANIAYSGDIFQPSLLHSLPVNTAQNVMLTTQVPVSGLAAALRATINNNPQLKGKQAQVDEQQFRVSSAEAQRYPTLSAQANNLRDDFDQATFRLTQPLWAFGKIDTAIAQAQSGVSAQQWQLLDIQRRLLEETATAYAQIEGITQRVQVAQSNIDAHQGYYLRIERRQKGHLSSKADRNLVYARLLQAQAQLQSIDGELMVAQTNLLALTQVQVSTDIVVNPQLAQLPAYVDVYRLAIENHADVHVKKHNIELVRIDLKAEQLRDMPTLSFRVETDLLDNDFRDSVRVGLSLDSNFEGLGFVTQGRIKSAVSRLAAARFDLDNSLNDVRRRVDSLMQNRQVQGDLIEMQRLTVDAMQETLESFLRQYEIGRKTWLEVLNTQRELTTLQLQAVQTENDWLILSLRIKSLIGGLDEQAGINMAGLTINE